VCYANTFLPALKRLTCASVVWLAFYEILAKCKEIGLIASSFDSYLLVSVFKFVLGIVSLVSLTPSSSDTVQAEWTAALS
jgi:hypothetical protein